MTGTPDLASLDPRDTVARTVNGAFVVVVEMPGGRYMRRVFLSVAAAEKAVANATSAGRNATIFLAELKPLWRVVGHEFEEAP